MSQRLHAFWKSDTAIGLATLAVVVALQMATGFAGGLEQRFYDWVHASSSRKPSDKIAIIAIDDASIANLGRWPWPRDIQARLLDVLQQGQAKVVVHTALFFEPQQDRGLTYIRQLRVLLPPPLAQDPHPGDTAAVGEAAGPQAPPPTTPATADPVQALLAEAEITLDPDRRLAESISRSGTVLLASAFELGNPQGNADAPLPATVMRSTVPDPQGYGLASLSGQYPLETLAAGAAGVGHLNQWRDSDGVVRREPLLVNYFGNSVPSMAVLAAMRMLNLTPQDLRPQAGEGLRLGQLRIPTGDEALLLPQFYAAPEGREIFSQDSFADVLNGKVPASKFAGKVVVIGATAAGVGVQFAVPGHAALTPAHMVAHTTSSILQGHAYVQPAWGLWVMLGASLLVTGYVALLLPRLSAGAAAGATGLLLAALLGTEGALLFTRSLWLPLTFASALLVLGHLALTTRRFLVTEAGKVKSDAESAETNRMMGLALQGQGQLDMAFDRFRRVPWAPEQGDALLDNLYHLALDFERKRQFNKAEAVYQHIHAFEPKFKDVQTKLQRAHNLSETVILGGGGGHPGGTLVLDKGAVEKPMLGRYQVEKELGKGAMGVVYQGRDPKIGRVVAIKTMALSQEFAGSELDDARERFFREAETAGRLQHAHIVTIFDAGEEHDLAYIAMEFLKGRDLSDHCREGNLLPAVKVVSIVQRVAQALHYAHSQSVVHRDIKPANIMYELSSDTVKVTDFGIARITDSSKTKTGLVLGTPSYMAPEQLAGQRVDGRADLYALGVMLYQMLTGELPLRAQSMAELMYKIANEEAPDLRLARPDLPEALAQVVAHAMRKRPEDRYQDGDSFAQALASLAPLVPATDPRPAFSPQATAPIMRSDNNQNFEKTSVQPRNGEASGAP